MMGYVHFNMISPWRVEVEVEGQGLRTGFKDRPRLINILAKLSKGHLPQPRTLTIILREKDKFVFGNFSVKPFIHQGDGREIY